MPAPTPDGRLLCAAVCTYAIDADGPLDLSPDHPDRLYFDGAGFVEPPATFVGGRDLIDACLVGVIPDGVVVAFRGTLPLDLHRPPTLVDWFGDFNANPVAAPGYPGFVHPGFLGAVSPLTERLVAEVNRQRAAAPAAPLLLTGHSKGGAMAALSAWHLRTTLGMAANVVTFEAPKPGNLAFRDAYNAQVSHKRYEHADDIVPHLPPSPGGFLDVMSALHHLGPRFAGLQRFDYEQPGVLSFIDANRMFHEETPELRDQRTMSLALQIVKGHFNQIAMDHSIACGSGCMSAICPNGVCPEPLP
jgi:hypothetical protein